MSRGTIWEVHEYVDQAPVLAFSAGAGVHPAPDAHGTAFYVERESGWRDGAAMRDTGTPRLLGDGDWQGPQYKEPFLVTLEGYYVAASPEGAIASIRDARNTLGRKYRTGRLLADDPDSRRLYADVVRGGPTLVSPSSPLVGSWSMSFKVNTPKYYSEALGQAVVGRGGAAPTSGRAYTDGYRSAYQSGLAVPDGGAIRNGGDAAAHFVATFVGPLSSWSLTDGSSGRTLQSDLPIPARSSAVLDTSTKTYLLNGQNVRWGLFGEWFMLQPGESSIVFTPTGDNANTKCTITYPREVWEG